ncbi:inducible mutagenesis protein A [uncultured Nitratireductor sp.]|uniref:ImuA family protein n=1 Tax=uncultured Nitratireductor sp. TaxID=520953 RepID=UPI0025E2B5D8|nr:inducible mutagenesis protein A [uncultured Nitratireductor sp.]
MKHIFEAKPFQENLEPDLRSGSGKASGPAPEKTGSVLEALRRRIATQERLIPTPRPSLKLGLEALDAALPGSGLKTGALHEILPATHGDVAAGLGFGICLLARLVRQRPGPILWAAPTHLENSQGALYPPGLAALGLDPNRLIRIEVRKPIDVLWALEEGLSHAPLAAAVGILPDNARAYDFAASRRLGLRAARQGVTAFVMRGRQASAETTAAETRWSVASLPAVTHFSGRSGPGAPRWRLALLKCRQGISRRSSKGWDVEWDHETLSFRLSAPLADRTAAPTRARTQDTGQRTWAEAS